MLGFVEKLYQNIGPFVVEIAPALGAVFVLSFGLGWIFARRSSRRPDLREN